MKFNPSLQQMELDITIVYLTIMKLLFFSNTCTAFPHIICTEASWTLLFVFLISLWNEKQLINASI